jgi:hypothetical protein
LQEQDQKHSLDELQAQRQYATDLEKEIQALTEKSQLIEARHKQKVNIILAAIFNGKTTVNISDVQTMFKQLKCHTGALYSHGSHHFLLKQELVHFVYSVFFHLQIC